MTLGEIITKYREENGLSQRDFAAKCGLSNVTISYIERNKNPKTGRPISQSFETYYKIARVLGMDINDLFRTLDVSAVNVLPDSIKTFDQLNMKYVPLIGEVAAGEPILATESYDSIVAAPAKADYALEIKGESMVPTYLPGDIIFIREQPVIDFQGQVAVVLLDDEATVKHVYRKEDGLLLVSDNPAYEPMFKAFEDYNSIRVLGKVCGFMRMYKE